MSLTNMDVLQGSTISAYLFKNMQDTGGLNDNFNLFGYESVNLTRS